MGEVTPIRRGARIGTDDLARVIWIAYQKAAIRSGLCVSADHHACAALLNQIVDSAARGLRDADRLCCDALERQDPRNRNSTADVKK